GVRRTRRRPPLGVRDRGGCSPCSRAPLRPPSGCRARSPTPEARHLVVDDDQRILPALSPEQGRGFPVERRGDSFANAGLGRQPEARHQVVDDDQRLRRTPQLAEYRNRVEERAGNLLANAGLGRASNRATRSSRTTFASSIRPRRPRAWPLLLSAIATVWRMRDSVAPLQRSSRSSKTASASSLRSRRLSVVPLLYRARTTVSRTPGSVASPKRASRSSKTTIASSKRPSRASAVPWLNSVPQDVVPSFILGPRRRFDRRAR